MSKSNRKKNYKKAASLSGRKVGNIFSSPPIKLNWVKDETEFYRADIEFFGIDISGPSYFLVLISLDHHMREEFFSIILKQMKIHY